MILYRGTPTPEKRPKMRDYACIYFTSTSLLAAEYAAGEGAAVIQRGVLGYVQKYQLDKPRLFDFEKHNAWELGEEFEEPSKEFVERLINDGYTGIRYREDICLFSTRGLRLIARWRVVYDEGKDGFIYSPT